MKDTFKETCVEYISTDKHLGIYTSEKKYINKIKKYKEEYPDDVDIVVENKDGSLCANVPIDWFKFPKPIKKRKLTNEQKEKLANNMKNVRNKKGV